MNEIIRVGKKIITVEGLLKDKDRLRVNILSAMVDKELAFLKIEIYLLRKDYTIVKEVLNYA